MKVHLGLMLITFIASVNCRRRDIPLLQNISRLLESVVQSQSAFNASLARLEQRHDSLNASLAAMEQSNDASFARVEQSLSGLSSRLVCFKDCLDYRHRRPHDTSGIITTLSQDGECSQQSYCDMETDGGGWTVFQRHQNDAVSFNRSWVEYKNGFGDLSDSFWWGNEKLAQTVNDGRQYELRIDLFDWEGQHRYAKYSRFYVAPESDNYRLSISGYTGNAGGDSFGWHNSRQFSTIDRDNDRDSSGICAAYRGGGGFWWGSCGLFSPNGRYYHGGSAPYLKGLYWLDWRGGSYSLKAVQMAFRAKN